MNKVNSMYRVNTMFKVYTIYHEIFEKVKKLKQGGACPKFMVNLKNCITKFKI